MCICEKLIFKISRGSMPPDSPTVLAHAALDTIFAGLTLNCFHRACCYQCVILSIILRILPTQKDVSFLSRKRVHLPYYTEIYILRTADTRLACVAVSCKHPCTQSVQRFQFACSNFHENKKPFLIGYFGLV